MKLQGTAQGATPTSQRVESSPRSPLRQATDIVSSFVSNNKTAVDEVPVLLTQVYECITSLGSAPSEVKAPETRQKPAVPVSRSVHHDYIVCLEDGKKLTMMKRYLRSHFDMSPEEYRRKWRLPPEYPMVAPAYAGRRSEFAKSIGLGKGVRRRSREGS